MAEIATPTASTSKSPALAYAGMGVGIVALGFSALFVRWAAAPGAVTGLYRMAIASLVLVPIALLRHGDPRRWPAAGLRMALVGGIALSFDLTLWNTAVLYTSAANATLLANTAPLWVAVASVLFFREKLGRQFWIGLGLVLAGAAAVLGADFLHDFAFGIGDLVALAAASSTPATTWRLIGRRHLASLPYVTSAGVASTCILLVFVLLVGYPLTGYPPQTWASFIGLGLVTQVLGYVAVGYALGLLPASLVSPTMVGQPVMTALLAVPLLGEPLSLVQWVGGAAVLGGSDRIVSPRHRLPCRSRALAGFET
jgi:drug/metabolite transporter (DMT)-like permease